MNKKMEWTHEKSIILCIALLIAIYTIALVLLPSHLGEDWGYYDSAWLRYLFQLTKTVLMTVCLTKAYMHLRINKRGNLVILWILIAFLVTLLNDSYINFFDIQYALQKLSFMVWPILMLFLATKILTSESNLRIGSFYYAKILYYILVVLFVWVVTDLFSYISTFKRNIPDMIYLFGCASIAWFIRKSSINKELGKSFSTIWEVISNLAFSIGGLVSLLVNNKRFVFITSSLKNPITNIDENANGVNWMGNRIFLMNKVWFHNSNLLGESGYYSNYDSSLVLIHQIFGWIATIAVLVIEVFLLYSVYRLYKEQRENGKYSILVQMLFYTICFGAGFGFLMDVLVVTSSRMGLILLGNYESFATILLFLYMVKNPLKKMIPQNRI